jgi:hypothetical protein
LPDTEAFVQLYAEVLFHDGITLIGRGDKLGEGDLPGE